MIFSILKYKKNPNHQFNIPMFVTQKPYYFVSGSHFLWPITTLNNLRTRIFDLLIQSKIFSSDNYCVTFSIWKFWLVCQIDLKEKKIHLYDLLSYPQVSTWDLQKCLAQMRRESSVLIIFKESVTTSSSYHLLLGLEFRCGSRRMEGSTNLLHHGRVFLFLVFFQVHLSCPL